MQLSQFYRLNTPTMLEALPVTPDKSVPPRPRRDAKSQTKGAGTLAACQRWPVQSQEFEPTAEDATTAYLPAWNALKARIH
jgi:hypothetical protein